MSDGKEVKRWIVEKGLYQLSENNYEMYLAARGQWPEVPTEVMPVDEHEEIVTELRAEVERLKSELGKPYDKVDRLFESNKKHLETIARQARVIEKLKVAIEDVLHERYSDDDVSAVSSDPLMILLTTIERAEGEKE